MRPSGDHVERIGSHAGLAGAVEVGDTREAAVRRGVDEGVQRRGELVRPPGAHRQPAGPAAEAVVAVRGVLDGLERRQHVVEGPSADAAAGPLAKSAARARIATAAFIPEGAGCCQARV